MITQEMAVERGTSDSAAEMHQGYKGKKRNRVIEEDL